MAEQLGFEQMLRDRRAIDADEACARAVRARMDVARQHFLAGSGLAGDQHRGFAGRDLLGELDELRHRVVAIDELAVIVGDRREHGGNQLRVGRQRNVFFGAGVDRGDRRARVGAGPASDDRHVDVLMLEPRDQVADVDADIHHEEVGAAAGPQHAQRLLDILGVGDGGAFVDRELGRERQLTLERPDDQEAHDTIPCLKAAAGGISCAPP